MQQLLTIFIPNLPYHILTAVGILGILISFTLKAIPFIGRYFEPIRVLAFLITIVAAWFEGGIYKEKVYKAESELKVAEAEKLAAEATAKIEYVFLDRLQVVQDTKVVVQEKIRDVAVNIDSHCKIAPEVIDILNDSAKNKVSKVKK